MDNTTLLTAAAAAKAGRQQGKAEQAVKVAKFLIVQIKDKQYAFYAEQIKGIVMEVPLYFVPFVPPYIRGFINRQGEPYTVFDLYALFEKEQLDSATFLISNFENDQIAFLVSGVIQIIKVSESEVHLISSMDDQDSFFLGSVSLSGAEVFILNLPSIIGKLQHDLDLS